MNRWNHNICYHPLILAAAPKPCAIALDAGCGEGALIRELRAVSERVIGIDFDRTSIESACAHGGEGVECILGDSSELQALLGARRTQGLAAATQLYRDTRHRCGIAPGCEIWTACVVALLAGLGTTERLAAKRRPLEGGQVRSMSGPHMSAKDALALYNLFEGEGIKVWSDGGWAADALLGGQARDHADLDIALETRFLERVCSVLAEHGYQQVPRDDTQPWNFVMGNGAGLEVDIHAFTFDGNGDGVYGPPENGDYYRADALTGEGVIEGQPVRCISPEWLVRFHTGYSLQDKDFLDITALCERFGIELPKEYRDGCPAAGGEG